MILTPEGAREKAKELLNDIFGKAIEIPVPLIYICYLTGIDVWMKPMEAIDSLAFRDTGGNIGILMNSRVFFARRCFSLAHELGHFFCGHLFSIDRPTHWEAYHMERAANVFAAEITMPHSIRTYRKWTAESLSEECCVSLAAARIRLEEWKRVA